MAKIVTKETLTIGILAVMAGLATAYGIRAYFESQKEEVVAEEEKPEPKKIKYLLAGTDLPADRVVRNLDVMPIPMTRKEFRKRFPECKDEAVIKSPKGIVNRRLKKPVKEGQPFLTTDFYLQGTGPSITDKLKPGFRAIPLRVPISREANVRTGMLVDVMFRANPRSKSVGQPPIPEKTVTLLRNIEVIDTERESSTGPAEAQKEKAKKTMLFTLAVPERQAAIFGVIEGRGEVWLVPTPEDEATAGSGDSDLTADTLAELLGIRWEKPAPPFKTVIYRRGNRDVNRFVDGELVAKGSVNRRPQLVSDEEEPSTMNDLSPSQQGKDETPDDAAPSTDQ